MINYYSALEEFNGLKVPIDNYFEHFPFKEGTGLRHIMYIIKLLGGILSIAIRLR